MKTGVIFVAMVLAGGSRRGRANTVRPIRKPRWCAQYCAGCHSDRGKAGGLSLAAFDAAAAAQHGDVTEKMIRKLRAGMMPPPGARRPDAGSLIALAASLETRIDRAARGDAQSRIGVRSSG